MFVLKVDRSNSPTQDDGRRVWFATSCRYASFHEQLKHRQAPMKVERSSTDLVFRIPSCLKLKHFYWNPSSNILKIENGAILSEFVLRIHYLFVPTPNEFSKPNT